MDFDISKWFDVLTANAWQYAWLAIACVAALLLHGWGWLPVQFDDTSKRIIVLLAFAFAALWLASVDDPIGYARAVG